MPFYDSKKDDAFKEYEETMKKEAEQKVFYDIKEVLEERMDNIEKLLEQILNKL